MNKIHLPFVAAVACGFWMGEMACEPPARAAGLSDQTRVGHETVSLDGSWTVKELPLSAEGSNGYTMFNTSSGEVFGAQVPGEIHLDLMRAGRMPDPDVSDNARARCRWPEDFSWWYRREFVVSADFLKQWRQSLVFDGIDLFGEVFVNGHLAGATKDAFTREEFNVKPFLHEGTNEVVVRVTSGTELVSKDGRGNGFGGLYSVRSFDERRFLRKPAYVYGWDWCDPLPNIGLWRGVRLEGRSEVVIHHLRLDTVMRGGEVALDGEVTLDNLHPWSGAVCKLEMELDPPQGEPLLTNEMLPAQVGHSTVPWHWVIPHPQLWWPNGMGAQPLYHLTARVVCGDVETDRQTQTIGLRTVEIDRRLLSDGSRFCFKVNGRDVFCKGGNWAPADLIPARMTAARYDKLVDEARDAHFTMFRVNGVGLYESDDFYNACDRDGILAWQDFSFSCFQYPDHDAEFMGLVQPEIESVVRRLRSHPSLALWDANNECTWGMADWWGCDATRPESIGGVKIYHETLPDTCHFLDPARPYWPGSSSGGVDPNSENAGDCHWWDKFGNSGDVKNRIRQEVVDECRARFVSEYGILGPPCMASVREYLKPGELALTNTAFRIHMNSMERGTVAAGIRYHYGNPDGLTLPDYLLYGQMAQAQLQGGAMEALRFRKDDPKADCEGALVWSYNDCWGEVGWAVVDHYARPKASYYWIRRACLPVKVIVRCPEGRLVTRVVNDTLQAHKAVVGFGWMRYDGARREWQEKKMSIPADGMVEVASEAMPSAAERDPRAWFFAATLRGQDLEDDQATWFLAPHREAGMAAPRLDVKNSDGVLEVSSPVYCHGVHVAGEEEPELDDDYFDLLPGVPRRVRVLGKGLGQNLLGAVMPIETR